MASDLETALSYFYVFCFIGITLEELRRRSKEEEEMDEHRAKLSVHDSAEF